MIVRQHVVQYYTQLDYGIICFRTPIRREMIAWKLNEYYVQFFLAVQLRPFWGSKCHLGSFNPLLAHYNSSFMGFSIVTSFLAISWVKVYLRRMNFLIQYSESEKTRSNKFNNSISKPFPQNGLHPSVLTFELNYKNSKLPIEFQCLKLRLGRAAFVQTTVLRLP